MSILPLGFRRFMAYFRLDLNKQLTVVLYIVTSAIDNSYMYY